MNINILTQYAPILIYSCLIICIISLVAVLPFVIAKRTNYKAKVKPYECGFESFGDMRHKFDIRFYLISILFIIFDLEIAFLFPWAIILRALRYSALIPMIPFLFILIVGFIYELKKGALEWT